MRQWKHGSVGAQSSGDWAARWSVSGSSPGCGQKLESVQVPGHLQSTAEVPLSKVPNPQMLR